MDDDIENTYNLTLWNPFIMSSGKELWSTMVVNSSFHEGNFDFEDTNSLFSSPYEELSEAIKFIWTKYS